MTYDFYFTVASWFPGNVRVKPYSKHSAPGGPPWVWGPNLAWFLIQGDWPMMFPRQKILSKFIPERMLVFLSHGLLSTSCEKIKYLKVCPGLLNEIFMIFIDIMENRNEFFNQFFPRCWPSVLKTFSFHVRKEPIITNTTSKVKTFEKVML